MQSQRNLFQSNPWRMLVIGGTLLALITLGNPAWAKPQAQQNLLVNPGFEGGSGTFFNNIAEPTGWRTSGYKNNEIGGNDRDFLSQSGPFSAASLNIPAKEGQMVLYMEAQEGVINTRAFQVVNGLDPTLEYTFKISALARILVGGAPGPIENATGELLVYNDQQFLAKQSLTQMNANQAWQDFSVRFSPNTTGEVSFVFIYINYHAHDVNGIALDDASLYAHERPTSAAPTADLAAYNAQLTQTAVAANPVQPTAAPAGQAAATAVPTTAANTTTAAQPTSASEAGTFIPLGDDAFTLPALEADGKMYYTVQAGDTLQRIARLTCGNVTDCVDTLKALNNLSGNVVQLGQRLVVGPLPDNAIQQDYLLSLTPAPTEAVVAAPTENVAPTAIPATPVPTLVPATGRVCIRVFADTNQDGTQNADEAGLDGIRLRLIDTTQRALLAEVLTQADQPEHCFADLPAARYSAVAIAPQQYTPTTQFEWAFTLADAEASDVAFGFYAADAGLASELLPEDFPWLLVLLTCGGLVLLFGSVGLIIVLLRRQAKKTT